MLENDSIVSPYFRHEIADFSLAEPPLEKLVLFVSVRAEDYPPVPVDL